MAENPKVKPEIVIDDSVDPDVALRIRAIDRRIHRDPPLFRMSLKLIGPSSITQSSSLSERTKPEGDLSQNPANLIIEFFRHRYDFETSYDEVTEKVIADNLEHQKKLATFADKRSELITISKTRSAIRQDPEAETARDDVRLSRFAIYLGRVAGDSAIETYPSAAAQLDSLPSAG